MHFQNVNCRSHDSINGSKSTGTTVKQDKVLYVGSSEIECQVFFFKLLSGPSRGSLTLITLAREDLQVYN